MAKDALSLVTRFEMLGQRFGLLSASVPREAELPAIRAVSCSKSRS